MATWLHRLTLTSKSSLTESNIPSYLLNFPFGNFLFLKKLLDAVDCPINEILLADIGLRLKCYVSGIFGGNGLGLSSAIDTCRCAGLGFRVEFYTSSQAKI